MIVQIWYALPCNNRASSSRELYGGGNSKSNVQAISAAY
jgi:hypothetical protein